MSKHTLYARGYKFEWDDQTTDNSKERTLLGIYERVGDLHHWTTYVGEDPYKKWNDHVSKLQENILDWIIELREEQL